MSLVHALWKFCSAWEEIREVSEGRCGDKRTFVKEIRGIITCLLLKIIIQLAEKIRQCMRIQNYMLGKVGGNMVSRVQA